MHAKCSYCLVLYMQNTRLRGSHVGAEQDVVEPLDEVRVHLGRQNKNTRREKQKTKNVLRGE